jgi:hypothetical protein
MQFTARVLVNYFGYNVDDLQSRSSVQEHLKMADITAALYREAQQPHF